MMLVGDDIQDIWILGEDALYMESSPCSSLAVNFYKESLKSINSWQIFNY